MLSLPAVFPFLLLHPRFRDKDGHSRTGGFFIKRILIRCALRDDSSINLPALYFLAMLALVLASASMVYYLLVITQGFPHLGSHYRRICFFKDLVTVQVLRSLCSHCMVPGSHGSQHHSEDVGEFEPGIITSARSLVYRRLLRKAAPEPRWFSSFIGDHLLLFLVGMYHIVGMAILPLLYWEAWPQKDALAQAWCLAARAGTLMQALQRSYLALMVMGFLYCTLEHAARFRPGHERAAQWHLTAFLLLWLPQFLLWYRVLEDADDMHKESLEELFHFLGAGPQIFITHSTAMMGAIVLGHHQHFQPCQDLPWRAAVPVGIGLSFCVLFVLRVKSVGFSKEASQGSYVLDVLGLGGAQVLVSILCLSWVASQARNPSSRTPAHAWGLASPSQSFSGEALRRRASSVGAVASAFQRQMSPLNDDELQQWEQLQRATAASSSSLASEEHAHGHGEMVFMDYDCVIIMLTFALGLLHSMARVYAHYSLREFMSETFQVLEGILFPLSLSLFVVVAWLQNPPKSRLLKFGMWMGCVACTCSVFSRASLEHCVLHHALQGQATECCYFPGLADFNRRKFMQKGLLPLRIHMVCEAGGPGQPGRPAGPYGGHGEVHVARRMHEEEEAKLLQDDGATYVFFQSLGVVGQVEFYFTLVGVFVKLILRWEYSKKQSTQLELPSLVGSEVAVEEGGVALS